MFLIFQLTLRSHYTRRELQMGNLYDRNPDLFFTSALQNTINEKDYVHSNKQKNFHNYHHWNPYT